MGYYRNNFKFGTFKSDMIRGTSGIDIVFALSGNDTIAVGAGNDVVFAGSGDDRINGGTGSDFIFGGSGFDTSLYAGSVRDYQISESFWGLTWVRSLNANVPDVGHDTLSGVEALYFAADDYTVYLDGRNNAVLAGDDALKTSEDATITIGPADLMANDYDYDGDILEITSVSAKSTAGASVKLFNGQVIYNPGTLFNHLGAGEVATDTFTYTVTDNNGSIVSASVTVTIDGVNDAPNLLTVDNICLIEGNDSFQPVVDARDADGDSLSYSLAGADAALFKVDGATGQISFVTSPEAGKPLDKGADNTYDLVLTVSDGTERISRDLSVTVVPAPATANRTTIAFDMVGSASKGRLNFTNSAPQFSSAGDGFGFFQVGAGSVPFSLVDDSAGSFPADKLGIVNSNANKDIFFGVTDTVNRDNPNKEAYDAVWSFDIKGQTDLGLSVDVGAMGDFEANDSFTLSYNIDGGAEVVLFKFIADEAGKQTYTLANGQTKTLNDPLIVEGTKAVLSNVLQTLKADMAGIGAVLNVKLSATADGGSEAFAMQNLVIEAAAPEGRRVVAFDLTSKGSKNLISTNNTAPKFSSPGDGFGVFQVGVSKSIPFSLIDSSKAGFANDKLGIIDASTNTTAFFGATDTQNSDNKGPVTASWGFDIKGFNGLSVSLDAGAMGDFEANDRFKFTYNIDGGAEKTLFEFAADEAGSAKYTLADGDVFTLNDPLTVVGTGQVLSNVLKKLSGAIEGTGAVLNISFTAQADGGSEAFAFQNLIVEAAGGGSGEPQLPTYSIEAKSGDSLEGDSGTTEFSFVVTRQGDVSKAGSVSFEIGGDVDAADFGGTLPTGTVHFAPGQTCATVTFEVTGDEVVEDDETFTVTLTNPVAGTIATSSASVEVLDDDDITLISEVQGDSAVSDYVDQVVTVEAIVTRVTADGFFLQEEDADSDGNDATSEGLFVYTGGGTLPEVGDRVVARGVVEEHYGQTQLDNKLLEVVSSDNDLPTAASVLLSTKAQDFEKIEGMRFTLESGIESEKITVIENYNLDRFGEITVSAGIQKQATQLYDAQTEAAQVKAHTEGNMNNRLVIDDGVSKQNPDEFVFVPNNTAGDNGNGYLDAKDSFDGSGPTLRLGAQVDGPTTGVMTYAFGKYRMLVDGQLNIDESTNSGARDAEAPDVGGTLQIASINVLNYFTTLRGAGTSGPNGLNPRGAGSQKDLQRQTDKLVDAFVGTSAEVFAVQEIENGGFGDGSAMATLVKALNDKAAAEGNGANYAFVDPTKDAGFIGTDAITTGIIYDANAVKLVGSSFLAFEESSAAKTYALASVLNAVVPASERVGDFQRNRPAVAATFEDKKTGATFTVVSNHFKSKGDSNLKDLVEAAQLYLKNGGTKITQADIDALVADPNYDQGNGQGFWNQVRADAASEVRNWIENDYLGAGVKDFIIMGDLNAYAKEDPVQTLTDSPDLVDVVDQFVGQDKAYSFVFNGQQGALDHAIASEGLASRLTGAAEWHINADEPDLLNYNSAFNNPAFYEPSVFASSDHDPLIVGLNTGSDTLFV